MASIDKLMEDPKEQLLKHVSDVRAVMLGSPDPAEHMQPMAPQVEEKTKTIYFFARKSSDLVKSVGEGSHDVHACVVEKDYYACLHGELKVFQDAGKIEELWNPVVAAWFEGGKADPDLALLAYKPKTASIWASDENPVTFAYQIAKANIKDQKPDIGARNHVVFG